MEDSIKITMKLRLAVGSDFTRHDGSPSYGKMYFQFSILRNEFDDVPYYLTENTDKETFKELYMNKQIYVPKSEFDLVDIINE